MELLSTINEIAPFISPLTLSCFCVLITLLFIYILKHRNPRNLPPGPYGLPFLGYAPFLGKFPHHTFSRLSKKYGSVFSLNMSGKLAVVLGDFKHMKEAYSKPAFLGTGMDTAFDMLPSGGGIIAIEGKPWQEQRRFTLKALKEVGFGNDKCSHLIMEEILQFRQYLDKLNGKPMNFFEKITASLINVISLMITQKTFSYNDQRSIMLKNSINVLVKLFEGSDFIVLPLKNKILSILGMETEYSRSQKIFEEMQNWFIQEVEEHRKHIDRDHLRDFLDYYIVEVEREGKNPGSSFTERMLLGNTQLVFFGANVDTRSAIYWQILCMAAFPEEQSRMQAEIDEVLGRDRFPTWADHTKMPYAEATMREAHRWKLTAPISCIRKTLEDTSVGGYFVPKDSLVFLNLWAIHNDPTYWKDPEVFRPERHLREDRKTLINHDHYMPFSYGRRQCPGERFANMEQFMYLVALLQHFTIRMPEGKVADFTEVLEINCHPRPQDICFIPRH